MIRARDREARDLFIISSFSFSSVVVAAAMRLIPPLLLPPLLSPSVFWHLPPLFYSTQCCIGSRHSAMAGTGVGGEGIFSASGQCISTSWFQGGKKGLRGMCRGGETFLPSLVAGSLFPSPAMRLAAAAAAKVRRKGCCCCAKSVGSRTLRGFRQCDLY